MRFRSITVRGLGPFAEQRVIDLEALEGRITAVCGVNGAGKTTLLELLLGAIYRSCPTRGSLVNLATSRDALLEVVFDYAGHTYRVKQLVDGVSRKSEAVLLRDEQPIVESTKVSAIDAFVGKHFPPMNVVLVSQFAAQKSQGFIDEAPTDRKAVLLRIAGCEQLEELAAGARAKAELERQKIEQLTMSIGEILRGNFSDDELRQQLDVTRQLQADAYERMGSAQAEYEAALGRQGAFESAAQLRARAITDRVAAERDVAAADRRLAELGKELDAVAAVLRRADEIRAAETELAELGQRETSLGAEVAQLLATERLLAGERLQLQQRIEHALRRSRPAQQLLAGRQSIDEAVAQLSELERRAAAARAAQEEASTQLEQLRSKQLVGAEGRIEGLRGGLVEIRDGSFTHAGGNANAIARATLERDDEVARDALEVPKATVELAARLRKLGTDRVAADDALAKARQLAVKQDELMRAEADIAEATAESTEAQAALVAVDEKAKSTATHLAAAKGQLTSVAQRRVARLGVGGPKAVAELARAEARAGDLRPEANRVAAESAKLHQRLASIVVPDLPPAPDLPRLKAAVDEARRAEREHQTRAQDLAGALERRQEAEARARTLSDRKALAELEMQDWTRLALDLGRNGLQAAISDAALPELGALTNSLLHSAFGPRFTVDLRSQRADAKGSKMVETLDVVVIDTLRGREDRVETFSPGEASIIAEALSLALTIIACRASGVSRPTLVRDEAGAALDPVNGRAWIAMLRRAVEIIGADRLLFVSHSDQLKALADSRIDL